MNRIWDEEKRTKEINFLMTLGGKNCIYTTLDASLQFPKINAEMLAIAVGLIAIALV